MIWLSRPRSLLVVVERVPLTMVSKVVSKPSSRTCLSILYYEIFLLVTKAIFSRLFDSPEEAKQLADKMLGHKLITKQTGAAGKPCNSVFVVERKYARREYYFAILMDRKSAGPVLVASSQGGVDIEAVAAEDPDAIITMPVDIHTGLRHEQAVDLATRVGFSPAGIEQAADTFMKLYKLFIEKDATQVEINPMAESSDHQGKGIRQSPMLRLGYLYGF